MTRGEANTVQAVVQELHEALGLLGQLTYNDNAVICKHICKAEGMLEALIMICPPLEDLPIVEPDSPEYKAGTGTGDSPIPRPPGTVPDPAYHPQQGFGLKTLCDSEKVAADASSSPPPNGNWIEVKIE